MVISPSSRLSLLPPGRLSFLLIISPSSPRLTSLLSYPSFLGHSSFSLVIHLSSSPLFPPTPLSLFLISYLELLPPVHPAYLLSSSVTKFSTPTFFYFCFHKKVCGCLSLQKHKHEYDKWNFIQIKYFLGSGVSHFPTILKTREND